MTDSAEGITQRNEYSRVIELERADAARQALEEAANALEMKPGNELYQRAWRLAADFIRIGQFKKLQKS